MTDESLKRFEEWKAKDTEFSKETFFAKVREVMEPYDLECLESGDQLTFSGKTAKVAVSHVSEKMVGGSLPLVTEYHELEYKFVARYGEHCCYVSSEINGHGEAYGSSGPCKTVEDLKRLKAHYGEQLKQKAHRQMSLFEFI